MQGALFSSPHALLHQPPPPFLSLVTLLLLTIPCTILHLFVTSHAVSFIMDEESGDDHISSALGREADWDVETHVHEHVMSPSSRTPLIHALSWGPHNYTGRPFNKQARALTLCPVTNPGEDMQLLGICSTVLPPAGDSSSLQKQAKLYFFKYQLISWLIKRLQWTQTKPGQLQNIILKIYFTVVKKK